MSQTSPESGRDPVEQLLESFLARWRRGERPSAEEYAARCPERADEIRELFPALVEMEQLKPAVEAATGALELPSPRPDPAARPAMPHPERLGDYRILRVIGAGGLGGAGRHRPRAGGAMAGGRRARAVAARVGARPPGPPGGGGPRRSRCPMIPNGRIMSRSWLRPPAPLRPPPPPRPMAVPAAV